MPWTKLNKNTIPRILTTQIKDARNRLESKFDKIFKASVRVDRLMNQGITLPTPQLNDLQQWKDTLVKELTAVNDAVKACYDNLTYDPANGNTPFPDKVTACIQAVDNLLVSLPPNTVLDGAGRYLIEDMAAKNGWTAVGDYVAIQDASHGVYRNYSAPSIYGGVTIYWSDDTDVHSVQGLILLKYKALGGPAFLGYPTSDEIPAGNDGTGRVSNFQNGSIYWYPSLGTFEVNGGIAAKYRASGGANGFLGFPITDETAAAGNGRYNDFQTGSIYWSPSSGTHFVLGGIRAKWLAAGGSGSAEYGYPATDEDWGFDHVGRFTTFERGTIYWHPNIGSFGVSGAVRAKYDESRSDSPTNSTSLHQILGYPLKDGYPDAGNWGLVYEFQNGGILFRTSDATAHYVEAGHFQKWKAASLAVFPGSNPPQPIPTYLGYAAGDTEVETLDGGRRVHKTWFDHGSVISVENGPGPAYMQETVRWKWLDDKGMAGCHGAPTSDTAYQFVSGGTTYQNNFEHGAIYTYCPSNNYPNGCSAYFDRCN
jgi:hypothetical protein